MAPVVTRQDSQPNEGVESEDKKEAVEELADHAVRLRVGVLFQPHKVLQPVGIDGDSPRLKTRLCVMVGSFS